jgi:hypothetical protein
MPIPTLDAYARFPFQLSCRPSMLDSDSISHTKLRCQLLCKTLMLHSDARTPFRVLILDPDAALSCQTCLKANSHAEFLCREAVVSFFPLKR